jgi:hypothetical protein
MGVGDGLALQDTCSQLVAGYSQPSTVHAVIWLRENAAHGKCTPGSWARGEQGSNRHLHVGKQK